MSVAYVDGGATLSADQVYRYFLWRQVSVLPGKRLLFVMCNPSTADARDDDPTVRRCAGFAVRERCERFAVVNLWAFRATDPIELHRADDPVGEFNDAWILTAAEEYPLVVFAWGAAARQGPHWRERMQHVDGLLRDADVWCLGRTKTGEPRHPLMLPRTAALEAW